MSTHARSLAANWDIAVTSSALLLIVGGMAAPHVKRLVARPRDGEAPRPVKVTVVADTR